MRKIGVEIENGKTAELIDLEKSDRGRLCLAPLADYQTTAEIKLYLLTDKGTRYFKEITVSHLPPKPSGECRIDLLCKAENNGLVRFKVLLEGTPVLSENHLLPSFAKKNAGLAVKLVSAGLASTAAVILLLFALGFLDKTRYGNISADGQITSPVPSPAVMESMDAEPPASAGTAVQRTQATGKTGRNEFLALPDQTFFIYFDPDTADIPAEQRQKLDAMLKILTLNPELYLVIRGHCATAGSEKGRVILSEQRAVRVFEYLKALGWQPSRKPLLEGAGDSAPISYDENGQYLNRRVEIKLGD